MRVKMRTTIANAKITAIAGSVIDVTEKEAEELLKGGYAEQVKETPAKAVTKQTVEEPVNQSNEKPDNKAGGKKGK
jgi:hypothetical protein